jgi:hypothetical protein
VWFAWGAENDEIEVPKKSAETGGHHVSMCRTELTEIPVLIPSIMLLHNLLLLAGCLDFNFVYLVNT